ncbi:MAG: ribosome recycling factor [Magnetococcus sp. WYHC-3]
MDKYPLIKDARQRMKKAVDVLHEELGSLRTGRASASLIEHVMVTAYGTSMPLNQMATITAPEPRMLTVQPWDKGTLVAIEKGIQEANLGLNPLRDGAVVRVPLPELTEERRKEIVKVVHKYGEQAKVAVRGVRRDVIDRMKKAEKHKEMSLDELHQHEKEVQELTDQFVKEVDDVMARKEKDVMTV